MRRQAILLCFCLLLPAAAQDDWSPKYVPPKSAASQPQPQTAGPAPLQPVEDDQEPVREFNDPEYKPAAPPPPAVSGTTPAVPAQAAAAPPAPAASAMTPREAELRALAEQFAPVIYHRLAGTEEEHRFDYPTSFDFDGDWVGNNNWQNSADPKHKLWAYLYYNVIESEDHYFILYAAFHPRDWSVAQSGYKSILDTLQDRYKDIIGQGAREQVEFNHENDLEGALVMVDKWAEGGPAAVAVSSVAHNHLLRAIAPGAEGLRAPAGQKSVPLRLTQDGRPILYIESQKHGVRPWIDEKGDAQYPMLSLTFGRPTEFSQVQDGTATYGLISLYKTWWKRAKEVKEPNLTFGTVTDFADRYCEVPGAKRPECEIGVIGAAIKGDFARPNSAVAPWAWYDVDDRELPPGAYFFDPVIILKRHFGLLDTTEKYLYNPYLGIDAFPAKAR